MHLYFNFIDYPNGNAFDAIDLVMEGGFKIAFALAPPPGHHSGYFGPMESPLGTWGGSCIVNNIAIGAPYGKFRCQNEIKKIKIIDFDTHHGNRTEEIVQMLKGKGFKHTIQTEIINRFYGIYIFEIYYDIKHNKFHNATS